MQNPGNGESKRSAEAGRKWKTEEEKEKVRGSEETGRPYLSLDLKGLGPPLKSTTA